MCGYSYFMLFPTSLFFVQTRVAFLRCSWVLWPQVPWKMLPCNRAVVARSLRSLRPSSLGHSKSLVHSKAPSHRAPPRPECSPRGKAPLKSPIMPHSFFKGSRLSKRSGMKRTRKLLLIVHIYSLDMFSSFYKVPGYDQVEWQKSTF